MSKQIYLFGLIVLCFSVDLFAQTNQWRLVWDKNAVEDTVVYYVVYRQANALPSVSDSIGWRPHPAAQSEDSVVFSDADLNLGTQYFYRVVAVDYRQRRSGFSEAVDAAIPEITFGSLTLTVDTNQALDTVTIDLDDDDFLNDPDDQFDVTWSTSGGSQISVSIDNQNRARFITPTNLSIQETIQFSVVDPDGFYDERSVLVTLTAANTNQVPEINSSPQQTIIVGQQYQYTVSASDPDGDNLNFTMTEGPSFLSLTPLNSTSARISGTPTQTGSFRITIVVNDGRGGVDDQTFFLNVMSDPGSGNIITGLASETFGSSIVRLSWETTELTKDYINYGLNRTYDFQTLKDTQFKTEHEFVIKGLWPDTTYHYQIVSETQAGSEVVGPDATFNTEEGTKVDVFPIPFVAAETQNSEGITFVNVPESSTIVIYNLMAEPVFTIDDITHVFNWNVKNKAGKDVSAGLYIYHIKDKNDIRLDSGKLIIVR